MEYILKASGIIILFFAIYKLFLERDTFFHSIRLFLLSGIALAFIIPLISITTYVEAPTFVQSGYEIVNTAVNSSVEVTPFNWTNLLTIIYTIGVIGAAIYFIINIFSLIKLLSQNKFEKHNTLKIFTTDKQISPFSFFNYIVYNPSQFSETELKQLLNHEQTHALQKHSIDMLMAQLLVCVQWFNPLAWLYKKAVNQNLEYIADQSAKHTVTPKNYSYLLLKTTQPHYQMAIANNFYNSLIKKRIIMLHKNNSHRLQQFKLALILPLLAAFIVSFNTKVVAQQKDEKYDTKITTFSVVIVKDTKNSNLDLVKTRFQKFGYSLKVSNLKRNDKNEITSIKIIAKKGKSNAQFATNGDKPIQPIKIEYDNNSDRLFIGNTSESYSDSKGKSYFYSVKKSIKSDYPISKKLVEAIFVSDDGDSTVVFRSNSNNKNIWKDKKGKPFKSKMSFKVNKNGDIDASNNKNDFYLYTGDGSQPIFVVDGKVMKDGFLKKLDPNSIKSIVVLKGNKAINKYGRKGKNGVIEITLKKKK